MDAQSKDAHASGEHSGVRSSPQSRHAFAERLRHVMDARGLGTSETARRVREHLPKGKRFNPSNLSHYRAGRAMPRLTYLEALSRALGVDKMELTGVDETFSGPAATSEIRVEPVMQDNGPPEAPDDARCASDRPVLRIEDRGEEAHIELSQTLPWPVVLNILQALKAGGC